MANTREAAVPKKKYHQGHDIKSILLNISTTFLFVSPFAIYFDRENTQRYLMVVVGALAIAFLTPPVGPYRPHPYSDWERNKPFTLRQ
mmetsp:Transcript_8795/g.16599  ORF Transcript_8795/g.16599 Transcript_8795/m.16599 type:complete len:88 (-) Transcript_8795:168-431(-)|eukprot:CAMPEP_0176491794 /NCGR_PEP_ID=MMETSP0200_2-20121128/8626_1 /TAXON_ID=947934 /ORGANISM="Chaetoceros sp., Strain GSL56" /LENGTH=87 /DNA_ID=CAMNT_0017889255 /DNA_START=148 /DNA_END=411 /DNA_ORIENTATION=-